MSGLTHLYLPGALTIWCALIFAVASLWGYMRAASGDESYRLFARRSYHFFTMAVVLSTVVLGIALLRRDFRIEYVFQYSGLDLPAHYQFAAFWAGQKGSFLIWLFWGAVIGVPLARAAKRDEAPVMGVYILTLLGLVFILVRENPFVMLDHAPVDGKGLNPLLQDDWMVIHPPIMFIGYASSAIPFAFAVSALWRRDYKSWATRAFPWALGGFLVLGTAILMGGYWAYKTLGWGGYWGWDPVENASLVPWLLGTALIHGLYLERTKGRYRRANLTLSCLLFMSVLYGTFLTRSGVLADFSVHSFVDLGISGWLVGLMAGFGLLSAYLLMSRVWVGGWRKWVGKVVASKGLRRSGLGRATLSGINRLHRDRVRTVANEDPVLSRGSALVLSTITVLLSAVVVAVGTSSPLLTRFMENPGQVGPSFYNTVNFPLAALIAVLLALVPYLTWGGDDASKVMRKMLPAAIIALVVTVISGIVAVRNPGHLGFLFLAAMALVTNLQKVIGNGRKGGWAGVTASGGYLAHVGVGMILLGILASSAYDKTAKGTLEMGVEQQVGDVRVTFEQFLPAGALPEKCDNKECMQLLVVRPDGSSFRSYPKLFVNQRTRQLMVNPDIEKSWTADLYISPIEFDPGVRPGEQRQVRLAKDQSISVDGTDLTFLGFELNFEGDPQTRLASGQPVVIGAGVQVNRNGEQGIVQPTYSFNPAGSVDTPPVPMPGGGQMTLAGVNPTDGSVTLAFTSSGAAPAKLAVDISHKPLIKLVWWGLYVVGIGGALSTMKRLKEALAAG